MKFKNETKEDVVIPVIHNDNLPSDKLIIKDEETKEVPYQAVKYAEIYGLTPVEESPVEAEESSINQVKVETKKLKKEDEMESLNKIKGIGKETFEDIKRVYPNLESLKKSLQNDLAPFRNDICKKLKKHLNVVGKGE